MKKILLTISAIALVCQFSTAQTSSDAIRQHKAEKKQAKSELNEKVSRDAKKEARKLAAEGWVVSPGQLPLEKQLDRAYVMEYELDEDGGQKYFSGQGQAVGTAYDAARLTALNNAKLSLAGMIETEVTALVEGTLSNSQISKEDAASINDVTQASKSFISNKLGRVIIATECYREVKKNVEVSVRIAYNTRLAMNAAKEVIKMKLEEQGKDLHEQLDKIWADYK